MQLLRDNLTLWTSSDGAEGEAGASGDAAKETEKTAGEVETKTADSTAEPKAEAETTTAPAPES